MPYFAACLFPFWDEWVGDEAVGTGPVAMMQFRPMMMHGEQPRRVGHRSGLLDTTPDWTECRAYLYIYKMPEVPEVKVMINQNLS